MSPSLMAPQAGESAYEMKFPLHASAAREVREWARMNLAPDPHGSGEFGDSYEITSLYLDTENLDVFHGSRGVGKSKYRIRQYDRSQAVFLERKQKKDGAVRKWRTLVDRFELNHLAASEPDETWSGHWYYERLQRRALKPVCQIRYERTARIGASDLGTIRLTLDEGLVAVPQHRLQFSSSTQEKFLNAPVMLELKYRQEMPLLFKRLVQEFRLEQKSFSKYKLAVLDLGMASAIVPEASWTTRPEQLECRTS